MNNNRVIYFWGLCDVGSIIWFIGWRIVHKQIPFYYDILQAKELSRSFGMPYDFPFPVIITYFVIVLYVSLFFSGYYLLRNLNYGAVLSHIQCPFRILTLIPPSIFFITWPV